ncbi:MAG: DUF3667 domain-containing protein [Tenacibaculum sp.]|nr:DUF3667 domain-containing protein [Tenacibaculum sp.]
MTKCKKCNEEIIKNYCPNCGIPKKIERIDFYYILSQLASIFTLQKGIFYTIKEVFIRPNKSIKNFILYDRNSLVKPIIFLFLTSFIYALINRLLNIEILRIEVDSNEILKYSFLKILEDNIAYMNIIFIFFIAMWLRLFFRKQSFNFFEILILLCFVIGNVLLMSSIFNIIQSLVNIELQYISFIIVGSYTIYSIFVFFGDKKTKSLVKVLGAYVLGILTATLLITIVETIIHKLTNV